MYIHCHHNPQDGYTPLMLHAESGNEDVVTCLVENYAQVDAYDKVHVHHTLTACEIYLVELKYIIMYDCMFITQIILS